MLTHIKNCTIYVNRYAPHASPTLYKLCLSAELKIDKIQSQTPRTRFYIFCCLTLQNDSSQGNPQSPGDDISSVTTYWLKHVYLLHFLGTIATAFLGSTAIGIAGCVYGYWKYSYTGFYVTNIIYWQYKIISF